MLWDNKMYGEIPIWENRRRVAEVIRFRNDIVEYFNDVRPAFLDDPVEGDLARRKRRSINFKLAKIRSIVLLSGTGVDMYYSPPPAVGGLAGSIDLIANIFNLHNFQTHPQYVVDVLERSIGVYEDDKVNALVRTLNPFFWLDALFDYVASIPLKLLSAIGLELSGTSIGRLLHNVAYAIEVIAAAVTILTAAGYMDELQRLLQNFRLHIVQP